MNTEQAKPGDTIRITRKCELFGKEFLIIERPPNKDNSFFASSPWVIYMENPVAVECPKDYEIINSVTDSSQDVDKRLYRQRDANLNSVFG